MSYQESLGLFGVKIPSVTTAVESAKSQIAAIDAKAQAEASARAKIIVVAGTLALAGVGYWFWKKRKA